MKKLKLSINILAAGFVIYSIMDSIGSYAQDRSIRNLTRRIEKSECDIFESWATQTNNVRILNSALAEIKAELERLGFENRFHMSTKHLPVVDALSSNMFELLWSPMPDVTSGIFGRKTFVNGIMVEVEE